MSAKEEVTPPPLGLDPLVVEQDAFLEFRNLLHATLSLYFKDMKNEGSWIHFYVTQLRLKAPGFSFGESRAVFKVRLENLLDLMELAHLYCKISNPKEYKSANHESHRSNHKYFLEMLSSISDDQFFELRQYLKSNVMFGSN